MNKLKIPCSVVHSGWGLSQRTLEVEDLSLREENCKGNFEEIGWIVESKVVDLFGICNRGTKIFFERFFLVL